MDYFSVAFQLAERIVLREEGAFSWGLQSGVLLLCMGYSPLQVRGIDAYGSCVIVMQRPSSEYAPSSRRYDSHPHARVYLHCPVKDAVHAVPNQG